MPAAALYMGAARTVCKRPVNLDESCRQTKYLAEDANTRNPGKIDQRWPGFGGHPGTRKRVLESSCLKDAISAVDSTAYRSDGELEESVDQDAGTYTPGPSFPRALSDQEVLCFMC